MKIDSIISLCYANEQQNLLYSMVCGEGYKRTKSFSPSLGHAKHPGAPLSPVLRSTPALKAPVGRPSE